MSQDGQRRRRTDPRDIESGVEALRASSAFRGPVEPADEDDCREHLTLIYETDEQQFASLTPFLKQGIERGEQCVYIRDETPRADVERALRDAGVDVDAALETGQLAFHTAEETYLPGGTFDPDEVLSRYTAMIEAATAEFEGMRVVADTGWIVDEATDVEDFMEYESRVNDVIHGEDSIALCQYDRDLIPADVLTDIIRTHPHIVYDNTVCHNFYYIPPEELFGPDEPTHEVDRMLGTLSDRTETKVQLNETIDELEASNDQLRRFAYVASHDLQEPLRMVSSYLQLLENRYGDDLDDEAREYIEFAVDGADRMREMVDDLLAYSRIDREDPAFERVDTEAVVADVVADLRMQIQENRAEIVVDDTPTVVGGAGQLEKLFRNLLSNAIKYSGDEPPRIEISAERRGSEWVFSVADNGIGIDRDHTDQVFEIFNRLHGQDEYSGTGIGLALCRRVVENHGGDIWVDSVPGEGSTFYFTLPHPGVDPGRA